MGKKNKSKLNISVSEETETVSDNVFEQLTGKKNQNKHGINVENVEVVNNSANVKYVENEEKLQKKKKKKKRIKIEIVHDSDENIDVVDSMEHNISKQKKKKKYTKTFDSVDKEIVKSGKKSHKKKRISNQNESMHELEEHRTENNLEKDLNNSSELTKSENKRKKKKKRKLDASVIELEELIIKEEDLGNITDNSEYKPKRKKKHKLGIETLDEVEYPENKVHKKKKHRAEINIKLEENLEFADKNENHEKKRKKKEVNIDALDLNNEENVLGVNKINDDLEYLKNEDKILINKRKHKKNTSDEENMDNLEVNTVKENLDIVKDTPKKKKHKESMESKRNLNIHDEEFVSAIKKENILPIDQEIKDIEEDKSHLKNINDVEFLLNKIEVDTINNLKLEVLDDTEEKVDIDDDEEDLASSKIELDIENENKLKSKVDDLIEGKSMNKNKKRKRKSIKTITDKADVKEMIDDINEKSEELNSEERKMLRDLFIELDWDICELHVLIPWKDHGKAIAKVKSKGLKYKSGKFLKSEDEIIKNTFKEFCQLHKIPEDAKPFVYSKMENYNKQNQATFYQFLAKGLPERLVPYVFKRFCRLYNECNYGEFTDEENKTILEYMKTVDDGVSNSSFTLLSQKLNRPAMYLQFHYKRVLVPMRNGVSNSAKDLDDYEFIQKVITHGKIKDIDDMKKRMRTIKYTFFKKLAEELNILPAILFRKWCTQIYPKMFLEERSRDELKRILITLMIEDEIDDFRKVDCEKYSNQIEGSTLYLIANLARDIKIITKTNQCKGDNILEKLKYAKRFMINKYYGNLVPEIDLTNIHFYGVL